MPDEESVDAAVDQIVQAGCGTVGWTGFAESAAQLRTALTEADHASISIIGSDALKADAYLVTTDGAGDGTVLTCGCVDLAASTRPEAGRFIHDFQSAYGSPPGAFAAEGWDVGGMLARAFGEGASDREAVAATLAGSPSYEGLANTYRFTGTGELAPGAIRIHTFRAEGLRWVGPPEEDVSVPVGTPGYLSVASCRTGRPFVYRERGRLRGFDVEVTSTIARRLGLTLAWSDRPCRAALAAVTAGTLDAVLAPSKEVPQGTPTSGIILSQHVALVATSAAAAGQRPLLDRLGHGDTVAVVRSPTAVAWARDTLLQTSARIRLVTRRDVAYAGLGPRRFTALVDLEPAAWAAIERRPGLVVAESIDAGEHDVLVAKGPDAVLVAALDREFGRILLSGRYALLFAKYFPGTPIPAETGT
jgi:ABC-type amino acid transport substrate-binding protein